MNFSTYILICFIVQNTADGHPSIRGGIPNDKRVSKPFFSY